ncbi:MAG: DPP IV N-terminal domain-containing protein [Candidatus Acidiferrales bacterium]
MHRISRAALATISFLFAVAAIVPSAAFGQSAAAAAQNGKDLTLQRLFSPPFLFGRVTQGIEWAPDGKQFSYLDRQGAGRDAAVEMWTMNAASGERKVLVNAETLKKVMQPEKAKTTQATGLGRVQAENYLWAPDGKSLLFIGSNSLVLLDLATMTPKPILSSEQEIEDPKFSPDSRWISFSRNANLFAVNIASGETKTLTSGGSEEILKGKLDWVYPEELDARTAYWWSPDSSKIAYYEMDERPVTRYPIMDMSSPTGGTEYTRYPQAGEANPIVRVGIVDVTTGATGGAAPETRWMDSGANTDVYLARVNWLPDSRSVAIQRLNRAQTQLDLLFCDAATGNAKTILTETDKYWLNISDDLYFFSDNKRFLWSSERTGYRHFYLYENSGKQIAQLTHGDWAISDLGGFGPGSANHPAVDEKRGYIYFLTNKDDVRETQLYRVSLSDQSLTRITQESGTHSANIAPDAATFIDTYSNVTTPPRQDLERMDGTRVGVVNEDKIAELAEYRLSPVEFVQVSANDGTQLNASIIKPPDFDPAKKYPVLVSVYGGPHVQVVRNAWGGAGYLWHEILAEKGYIIFSLDNRGSWGRGHAFETPIYHHMGKVELQDQIAGVKYLESLGYVDPARIGITGGSYGGYMTLEALFNAADVFKAGVADAPVTDWKLYDTIYTERYMGRPQDNPEGYKDSSPVNQAANIKGKLMLVHGTGDDNVHFANSVELLNTLIDGFHYPDQLMVFPGRGHGISDAASRMLVIQRTLEFILGNL